MGCGGSKGGDQVTSETGGGGSGGDDKQVKAVESEPCKMDPAKQKAVDEAFTKLQGLDSKSLLKKHLTKEVFDELRCLTTEFGSTLLDVIQSGVENPDSGVGVYAPDWQSYEIYAPLLDAIIKEYHGVQGEMKNPACDFGDMSRLKNIDPEGNFVKSTRTRLARSLKKFPFNPNMTKDNYLDMEKMVKAATEKFEGSLAGDYHSLKDMTPEFKQKLIDDHFLYKENDRFLAAANALGHWPDGRGIFLNKDKTFLIWVGEEDHLRLISMQQGADLGEVVSRLKNALDVFSSNFDFANSPRHGFMTFCPTNLGTTIRSSVHIALPKLAADNAAFEALAAQHNLQIRGIHGEHSESVGGVYDISNKRRFGYTEQQVIDDMYYGILAMIEAEKALL